MLFDREEKDDRAGFSRRAMLIGAGQTTLFAALVARLYGLQIVDGETYALAADENRINIRLLGPVRGEIRDRFGRVVATNAPRLRVLVTPEEAGDLDAAIDQVAQLIPISEQDRENALRQARRQRRFVPVTLADSLTWEDFARLNLHGLHMPGVFTDVGWERRYPMGPVFAHVTGYVGAVSESEIGGDAVLRLPGFQIGKTGVEKTEDLSLRGIPGSVKLEVQASGRAVRELERIQARPGEELILTLDHELQAFALERLKDEVGAAVVMDVETGDVLAMASSPTFDPRVFEGGISSTDWSTLVSDKHRPLNNRASAGLYPPGSTFKIVTALAALAFDDIDPDDTISCGGAIYLGSHRFRCWKDSGHGPVDLRDALKKSCDVYFYRVAEHIGIDAIAVMARRLGLGETYRFAGSAIGVVPDKDWKRAAIGEPWYGGETLIAGIGQGYVLSTPLQLAVMTARVANGRFAVEPRFARLAGDVGTVPEFAPLDLPEEHIARVHDAMRAVVQEPGGTARRSRLETVGVEMAGKTGTSQVRSSHGRAPRRRPEDQPREERPHALFVAYAPADAPRYAIAVVVEHGGGGSRAAAPVAKDIMDFALGEQVLARTPYDGSLGQPADADDPVVPAGDGEVARG